jgi:quercetin dioxygenase-like cupin family protein
VDSVANQKSRFEKEKTMTIIKSSDAQTFEVQGNHMTKLIAPSTGATEVMAWRAKLSPGAASPPHRHDVEEVVVVLSGSCIAKLDGAEHTLSAGDACVIPPNTLHQVINTSDEPWECITAMKVEARFIRPDGSETPSPPWTK